MSNNTFAAGPWEPYSEETYSILKDENNEVLAYFDYFDTKYAVVCLRDYSTETFWSSNEQIIYGNPKKIARLISP